LGYLEELRQEFFADGGGDEPPVLDEDDERALDEAWKKAARKRNS
ncbi:MAG: hypothetical protein H0W28_10575, partial [Pyrinomonadaceae bacterium]|nr:hypothetical protein [Ardenticatenales bacterium]MBA3569768.1 hypothetical protein [Pyrinomonadaceae bacterium]